MPMKTCPACGDKAGPRTKKCNCGHEFSKGPAVVAASSEPMSLEKKIVATAADPPEVDLPSPSSQSSSRTVSVASAGRGRAVVFTPAGSCPVKPRGYKSEGDPWPNGPASDEEIVDWAIAVHEWGVNHDRLFAPEAIRYFARQFWDINGKEYSRVRNLIARTFRPRSVDDEPGDGDGN